MIRELKDKEGLTTGKQRIVILVFDLFSKEVEAGSGTNMIITFTYEIRTSPKNSTMLKNLLCKMSEENVNDIKFISYGLDSMTKNNTMREIIIQQNSYLDTVKIIPVFEIMEKDKEQEREILGQSQFFWLWNLQGSQKVKVNTYQ